MKLLLRSVAIGALVTISSFALPIALGINGDAQVGPNFINFGNYPTGTVYTPTPGYGTLIVAQPPVGIFLNGGVTAGEFGMIQSLNASMTPPGTILAPDPTTDLPFLTFDAGGSNLKVFLTELVPGSTTGPFSLVDTANGAVASFNIDGFVYNVTNKSRQDITGTFAATFNGTSVAQLEAEEADGTNIMTPFTGTFSVASIVPGTPSVPEPPSLSLLGVVLLGIGTISRRKLRK
jgi:hypothetical protein